MAEHPLSTIQELDPEFMKFLNGANDFVFSDGALSKKMKFLIAMAFDAGHGTEQGVHSLALAAKNAGATKEEITEAIQVAYHLTGVASVYTASRGLKDIF